MRKIILDRSGNLRRLVFYRFAVPFDDGTDGNPRTQEWIIVPRTPKEPVNPRNGEITWMWLSGLGDIKDRVVLKYCIANREHSTNVVYERLAAESFGGKKISPFIATSSGNLYALSDELKRRLEAINVIGARIDPIDLTSHVTGKKQNHVWGLQFVGQASLRIPIVIDGRNACPRCGRGEIVCPSCGYWNGFCRFCESGEMTIIEDKHEGTKDARIPFENNLWNIIEGKSWDGSDLFQSHGECFASKRFIDWLLRIHAAPFYAEPVYFCVDGMSDQQKKWFDDLQKPFEV